jgi:hypothetical protein
MEKEFSFIPSPSLAFGLLAQPAAPPPCFLSQAHDGPLASPLLLLLRAARAVRLGPAHAEPQHPSPFACSLTTRLAPLCPDGDASSTHAGNDAAYGQ